MQTLINKVDSIAANTDHYLVKAKAVNHPYFADFLAAGAVLHPLLTPREFETWCAEKMMLKPQAFNETTYLQYAVETSVVRYFGERFPAGFRVEAKINPTNGKDVDCVFTDGNYTFNVEVKCSDFTGKIKTDAQDAFKIEMVGRLPGRGEEPMAAIVAALAEGLAKQGKDPKIHVVSKSMDNSLKDHLLSAHEKFAPETPATEVNILVVGCDDARDMQRWYNYLYAGEGLFTPASFQDAVTFENVDLVVFTNQFFKHSRFFEKNVSNSWTLDPGFNLIYQNPRRRSEKKGAIVHFLNLLPNFSEPVERHVLPGSAPEEVKNTSRIPRFVADHLERKEGRYLFQNP